MRKILPLYLSLLALFGLVLAATLHVGGRLQDDPRPAVSAAAAAEASRPEPAESLSLLLLQALVIIAASRGMGRLARAAGQPEVIGEICAGLCLGPSLLGALWPAGQGLLFPAGSLDSLQLLSHLGLVIFMFVVGTEINPGTLRERAHTAVWVSHASIVVPFLLGTTLALGLYRSYAPAGVGFAPFALFLGTAMSVTAFPVLARIIHEKGLSRSELGSVSLTCAAVDDVTAWCVLAAVVGTVRSGSAWGALGAAGLCAAWVAVMARVVRPLLSRWLSAAKRPEGLGTAAAAAALAVAFASAYVTDWIGVHALFGAFLAGALMPRETAVRQALVGQIGRLTTLLLLPIFFTLTGLRTRIGLLDDLNAWLIFLMILLTAVVGKIGAGAAAARLSGMSGRDALALGVLMNARGLVELVVLNIGYDLGVIGPDIFAMMVLMALATTAMAGPLLDRILGAERFRPAAPLPAGK